MASKKILTFNEELLLGSPTRTEISMCIKYLVEPPVIAVGPTFQVR